MDDTIGVLLVIGAIFMVLRLGRVLRELRDVRDAQERLSDDIHALRRDMKNGAPSASGTVLPDNPKPSPSPLPATTPPPLPHTPRPQTQPSPTATTQTTTSQPPPMSTRPPLPLPIAEDAATNHDPANWMSSTLQALQRIWNWILMGSEERPSGVTLEYAIGTTWLVRAGIGFVVLCIGYFLKWSIEQGLLGDTARVLIAMSTGLIMLIAGMRMLNRQYQVMGQGLVGGGLLALYFSVYAAGPMYHILTTPLAFALMVFLTLTAGMISVKVDSLLVAVIGLAGGYGTPILLQLGVPRVPQLQAYVILLTLGVLGVAAKKQWRLLNYLSFLLSYVLVAHSMDSLKAGETPILLAAVIILFLLHASITCVYNILRSQESTTLEVIQTTLNAVACACFGHELIQSEWGRPYPALLSLGLALFYVAATTAFLRRRIIDRTLLTALIALAGGFTVWTLPLWLEKESLTIAFSLLACVFVWMGGRLGSRFLIVLGNALYALTLFRVVVWDLPQSYHPGSDAPMTWSIYWQALSARFWTFAIPIASFFTACRVKRLAPSESAPITEDNDLRVYLISDQTWERIFYWVGVVFLFIVLHLEFHHMFGLMLPLRPSALTALWCAAAAYFLWQLSSSQRQDTGVQFAVAIFMAGAILKFLVFDLRTYRLSDSLFYNTPYSVMTASFRMLDAAFVLLLVTVAAVVFTRRSQERSLGIALGYIGLGLLFLCSSLELNTLLHWKLPDFQEGGISAWWGTFGIALIAVGIWKNMRALRMIGLVMMIVVVAKVLLYDLADMLVIYRVIAFMILGVVMLIGAFAYIQAGRKFQQVDKS